MNAFVLTCCRLAMIGTPAATLELPIVMQPVPVVATPVAVSRDRPSDAQDAVASSTLAADDAVQRAQFTQPVTSPDDSSDPDSGPPTPEQLEEIMQLRRRTSPLRGVLLDDADFDQQLKEQFGEASIGGSVQGESEAAGVDTERETGSIWKRRIIISLQKRLFLIADELEAINLKDEAEKARKLGYGILDKP